MSDKRSKKVYYLIRNDKHESPTKVVFGSLEEVTKFLTYLRENYEGIDKSKYQIYVGVEKPQVTKYVKHRKKGEKL